MSLGSQRRNYRIAVGRARRQTVVFKLIFFGIDALAVLTVLIRIGDHFPGDDEIVLTVHGDRAEAAADGGCHFVPQRNRLGAEGAHVNRRNRGRIHQVTRVRGLRPGDYHVAVVADGNVGVVVEVRQRPVVDRGHEGDGIPVLVEPFHRDVVEITQVLTLVRPDDDEVPVGVHRHVRVVLRIGVVDVRLRRIRVVHRDERDRRRQSAGHVSDRGHIEAGRRFRIGHRECERHFA